MGLRITAYKNLSVVQNPEFDKYGGLVNWETQWQPGAGLEWSEKYFAGRGEGVESKKVYKWESEFNFIVGSYSGYNWWRSKLEQFSNGSLAFQELINFADNEGVIGYVVSKKLVKDFIDNEEKAIKFSKSLSDGDWWIQQYSLWRKAFEVDSENGAVDFR